MFKRKKEAERSDEIVKELNLLFYFSFNFSLCSKIVWKLLTFYNLTW